MRSLLEQKAISWYIQNLENEPDPTNIFPAGIKAGDIINEMIRYFLGEDWYCVDPLGADQVNEIALCEIMLAYKGNKKYRKKLINEYKKYIKKKKLLDEVSKI